MPERSVRTARAAEIVAAARQIVETRGHAALTMRDLALALGIKAPSLYKHFADKAEVESALIEDALVEMGTALHQAVAKPGRKSVVASLLTTYRRHSLANPNLYRLATEGALDRTALAQGVEEWAGSPFFLAIGEPYGAQALWAFAHGMVILEIDERFADTSDLDRTWTAGIAAFE